MTTNNSSIKTSTGLYFFQELILSQGSGKIDKEISFNNLVITRNILNKHGIQYGLMFGTLLGAIRDGDFIEWDEDTDLILPYEKKPILNDALHEFREHGLELVRATPELYSIMRQGQYIDLYFFKKSGKKRKSLCYEIDTRHVIAGSEINFKGAAFCIPSDSESLLEALYGPDWRIPQRNKHAEENTRYRKLLNLIKTRTPKIHSRAKYFKKILSGFIVK